MGVEKRGLNRLNLILVVSMVIIIVGVGFFTYNFILKDTGETQQPDPVSQQCAFFCETGQRNGFCSFRVNVNEDLKITCQELSSNTLYSEYSVQPCPTISCSNAPEGNSALSSDQTCSGLDGTWESPNEENRCPSKEGYFVRERNAEDTPPLDSQICCYYYQ